MGNVNLVGGDDGYGLRCVQFMWVPFVLLEFRRISSGRGYDALHLKDSWDESHIHFKYIHLTYNMSYG